MRLPLIPLSPYIQTSCEYAKVLTQTTKLLSEEQDVSIKALLEKSLNKEREKLDRLTKSMQTIQSSCLLDFNIYDIAKEIAYINCSLFRMVTLDETWLCNFDKQSNMVPLLDFHRYLSHSFAHQIIYGDPKKKSVIQLIHLAYILLHVYRDFSGCTAILTCLHMPEVRRLQSMWAPCPSKLISTYLELVAMLSPENNYAAYHYQLWVHTNRFLDTTPTKSQMIAIPFMHAHLAIIQNLVQTHASVQAPLDVVLSSAGQHLLACNVHLLEFCQQLSKIDPAELDKFSSAPSSKSSGGSIRRLSFHSNTSSSNTNRRSSIKSIKLATSVCLDLDLLKSDAKVYHWIVSRAYLTRSQLHSESLHVEPLAVGEIELESEEEHDLYWDFFHKDFVMKKEPPIKPSRSPKVSHANSQDPVQEAVDGLNVVDNTEQQDETTLLLNHAIKNDENNASSSEQALEEPIGDDSVNDTKVVANDEPSISENIIEPIKQDINPLEEQPANPEVHVESSISNEQLLGLTHEQLPQPKSEPKPQLEEDIRAQDQDLGPTLSKSPSLISFENDNEQSKDQAMDTQEEEDDDDDVDIIILTEEDDEEWTGYPLDSTPSQTLADTEEEEEWTGYPITSQDEEEDDEEEEVWKGYPIPQEEEQEQQPYTINNDDENDEVEEDDDEGRKSPVEVSLPSTPSEQGDEWKGYQKTAQEEIAAEEKEQNIAGNSSSDAHDSSWNSNNKNHHNQLHAIGKAAARRMQYSLSSTDTNRKRLPSPFAPSSST